jgi:hypothetical protein
LADLLEKRDRKGERCIICNQEKEGLGIKEDNIVYFLRWLNSHTVKYRNPNYPVVCRECFTKYRKQRKSYERKLISYLIIGFLFAGFIIVGSGGKPLSFLFGLIIIAFMYLLSLLSYIPELEIGQNKESRGKSKAKK